MITSQPGEDAGLTTQEPARGQAPCSDHKASPVKDRKSVSVNDCKGFELEEISGCFLMELGENSRVWTKAS